MRKYLKTIASLGALVLLGAGCGESGTEGKLRFSDDDGGGDGLVLPLAKGRSVNYTIRRTTFMTPKVNVTTASSSDDGVFKVTNTSGSKVTVRAVAEGEATLTVSAAEVEDQMPLEVRAEAMTWLVAKTSQKQPVGTLDARGAYNVAPGDQLAFEAPMYGDADGNRLSGAGPVGFGEATATGTMEVSAADESVEFTGGDAGDTATVAAPGSGSLKLRTTEALAPDSIRASLYSFLFTKTLQSGPTFNVPQGVHFVRFLPVDADGYAYIGSHELDMTVEVTEGNPLKLDASVIDHTSAQYCVQQASDSDVCTKWEGLPVGTFQLTVGKEAKETSKVTVTVGAVSETFTFAPTTIDAADAD